MAMYPNLSPHQLLPSGVSSVSRWKRACVLQTQSRVKMFVSLCQLKGFCFFRNKIQLFNVQH